MHFYGRNAKPSAQIEVKNSLRKRPLSLLSEVQPSGPNASSPGSYKPAAMAKRKHKKITPADEPEPGTRRSPRRAPTAGQRAALAPAAHAAPPTTPAATPTGPFQSPVEAAGDMQRLAKARAGLMSPEERQELYGLVAATMEALTRDEATKQKKADDRASEHAAKKRRAAAASAPDAVSKSNTTHLRIAVYRRSRQHGCVESSPHRLICTQPGRRRARRGRRHPRTPTLRCGGQSVRFFTSRGVPPAGVDQVLP